MVAFDFTIYVNRGRIVSSIRRLSGDQQNKWGRFNARFCGHLICMLLFSVLMLSRNVIYYFSPQFICILWSLNGSNKTNLLHKMFSRLNTKPQALTFLFELKNWNFLASHEENMINIDKQIIWKYTIWHLCIS